ncbi:hypothetical protein VKT23_015439 [Stygiomarasmius scandens]|uniref:Uncharacterized protein n=1 Tax=Marasmiellus scandens TaxID=2682957 RepID=A0ABR1J117_9AGAR
MSDQSFQAQSGDNTKPEPMFLRPLWQVVTPEREQTSVWDWVNDGEKPFNPWIETQQSFELLVPPEGQSEGKEWLYQTLDRAFSWGYQPPDRYPEALRAVFLARGDIGEYLRWDSPPSHNDYLPTGMDDLAWTVEQAPASRTRDGTLPRPTYSGQEVETRRLAFFDRYKTVFEALSASQHRLQQLGQAYSILSVSEDIQEMRDLILARAKAENAQRVLLQAEFEEVDVVAQNFLFLTAVCLVHAR